MKWLRQVKIRPNLNDIRIIKHTAIWPVGVGRYMVWLENYYNVERCCVDTSTGLHPQWNVEYKCLKITDIDNYMETMRPGYTYLAKYKFYRGYIQSNPNDDPHQVKD